MPTAARSPCAVIQGSDERDAGEVQIKDLILGAELAQLEKDRDDYLQKQAQAQQKVRRGESRRRRARGPGSPRRHLGLKSHLGLKRLLG